jgi:uncharacterized protein YodC (DUF2158 family)
MPKFKCGDAVRLKSGGPRMTISGENTVTPGQYFCKWFSGTKLNVNRFNEDELQTVSKRGRKEELKNHSE